MTSQFCRYLIACVACSCVAAATLNSPVSAAERPPIRKRGTIDVDLVETQPIVFQGKLYRFESVRENYEGNKLGKPYFRFIDHASQVETSPFAAGHQLGSALADGDTMYVFGTPGGGSSTINMFWSKDLKDWNTKTILELAGWELFNTSVCKAGDKYVMAFEVGGPPEVAGERFTSRFAESINLMDWELLDEPCVFTKERYSACPTIRHEDGWYYVVYLEAMGNYQFNPAIVRSRDLARWESSPLNPIMTFNEDDKRIGSALLTDPQRKAIAEALNRNNSDVDFCEYNGKTIINYSWGDQVGHEFLAEAAFEGSAKAFLSSWFPKDESR